MNPLYACPHVPFPSQKMTDSRVVNTSSGQKSDTRLHAVTLYTTLNRASEINVILSY